MSFRAAMVHPSRNGHVARLPQVAAELIMLQHYSPCGLELSRPRRICDVCGTGAIAVALGGKAHRRQPHHVGSKHPLQRRIATFINDFALLDREQNGRTRGAGVAAEYRVKRAIFEFQVDPAVPR